MVITVTCPSCASSFPVDSAKIPEGGVNARCTMCSDIFRIDKPVEAEEVATTPELAPPPVETPPEPVADPAPVAEEPAPVAEEPTPSLVDSPDDWVAENEELPAIEPEPMPAIADHMAAAMPAAPEAVDDPFGEAAPFEEAAPVAEVPPPMAETLPAPPAEEPAAPAMGVAPPTEEAEPAVEAVTAPVQGFTFGKRDPTDKAKRLARVLVSDMIMYNAERHQSALAGGTLVEDFEEEIAKSWKEYVEQVGQELADGPGRQFWTDALNDILAKGDQAF